MNDTDDIEPAKPPPLPVTRTLDKFSVEVEGQNNTILGNRYLCVGGALLLAAPTGIGKSSFIIQACIRWSLGKDHFGIKPTRPLKVLYIQAENDDGDIAEFRDGVFDGLNMTDAERSVACGNFHVVCESVRTGDSFFDMVGKLAESVAPDLIVIDPLFAYTGCNVSDQESMSHLLRNRLNPILQNNNCSAIVVHHTNKPSKGQEKQEWQAGDFAYIGSGSSELANWPRAIIAIRSIGSFDTFEVILSKRGKRAGIEDCDGNQIYKFYIHHGDHGICWRDATQEEVDAAKTANKRATGRPSSLDSNVEILRKELSKNNMTVAKMKELMLSKHGVSERTFFRVWSKLKPECEFSPTSERWSLKNL